jgi:hypothetical protein
VAGQLGVVLSNPIEDRLNGLQPGAAFPALYPMQRGLRNAALGGNARVQTAQFRESAQQVVVDRFFHSSSLSEFG